MIHRRNMRLCDVTFNTFQQLRTAVGKINRHERISKITSYHRITEPIEYKDFLELCYRAKDTRSVFRLSHPRRTITGRHRWEKYIVPHDLLDDNSIRRVAANAQEAGVLFVHFKTVEKADHEIAFEQDGRLISVEAKIPLNAARHYKWDKKPGGVRYMKGLYVPEARLPQPTLLQQRLEKDLKLNKPNH